MPHHPQPASAEEYLEIRVFEERRHAQVRISGNSEVEFTLDVMSKRSATLMHLAVPLALAAWALGQALRREPFGLEVVAAQLLGSGLFFAAPHLLWLAIAARLRLVETPWHAGLVVSSLALLFVAVSPVLGRGDPSGLPYHWLLYWPLAFLGQLAVGVATFIHRRVR